MIAVTGALNKPTGKHSEVDICDPYGVVTYLFLDCLNYFCSCRRTIPQCSSLAQQMGQVQTLSAPHYVAVYYVFVFEHCQ